MEITAIEKSPSTNTFDPHQLDRVLAEHLGRFGEMLRGDAIKARPALQKLLVDRVSFTVDSRQIGRTGSRHPLGASLGEDFS